VRASRRFCWPPPSLATDTTIAYANPLVIVGEDRNLTALVLLLATFSSFGRATSDPGQQLGRGRVAAQPVEHEYDAVIVPAGPSTDIVPP
jgi:hypothetical protein